MGKTKFIVILVTFSLFIGASTSVEAKTKTTNSIVWNKVIKKTPVHFTRNRSYLYNKPSKPQKIIVNLHNFPDTTFYTYREAKLVNGTRFYYIKKGSIKGWVNKKNAISGKAPILKATVTPTVEPSSPVQTPSSSTTNQSTPTITSSTSATTTSGSSTSIIPDAGPIASLAAQSVNNDPTNQNFKKTFANIDSQVSSISDPSLRQQFLDDVTSELLTAMSDNAKKALGAQLGRTDTQFTDKSEDAQATSSAIQSTNWIESRLTNIANKLGSLAEVNYNNSAIIQSFIDSNDSELKDLIKDQSGLSNLKKTIGDFEMLNNNAFTKDELDSLINRAEKLVAPQTSLPSASTTPSQGTTANAK
ncbi:hypothetical protein FEZ41_10080 [Lentilactobacillus parafarraginis]|nr:hypothetical protein [Lentilactobacillus parafarraginis]TLQ18090.1 hypothetical protein FEZ41_10080 [Lentilactobacillus parafarraginis]